LVVYIIGYEYLMLFILCNASLIIHMYQSMDITEFQSHKWRRYTLIKFVALYIYISTF